MQIKLKEELKLGQVKVVRKFLLFPRTLNKRFRWLEYATIKEEVHEIDVGGSMEWGKYKNKWVEIEFVD